jgi:DNA-binding Lrp family transcriptional regulator
MNTPKLREILGKKFRELQSKNQRFSLRGFASRLGVSSGSLSDFLSEKRGISVKTVKSILSRGLFEPHERSEIARAAGLILSNESGDKGKTYTRLSQVHAHFVAEWWHFAILSLLKTRNFRSDPKWIAKRLGLALATVEETLGRLQALGYIEKIDGEWRRKTGNISTPDDHADSTIQKGNLGLLHQAIRKMKSVPIQRRDYTSYVMAISPDRIPEAKEAIRRFQDELSLILESDQAAEVYQLGIQLFPLTE